jgi:hypothetical protein
VVRDEAEENMVMIVAILCEVRAEAEEHEEFKENFRA